MNEYGKYVNHIFSHHISTQYIHFKATKLHQTPSCVHNFKTCIYILCFTVNLVDFQLIVHLIPVTIFIADLQDIVLMTQLRSTYFECNRGNERGTHLPEVSNRNKARRGDKLQLVQEATLMPAEGMRAINRAFSQETPEHSPHKHTQIHTHTYT